jgi:hypothetical protein
MEKLFCLRVRFNGISFIEQNVRFVNGLMTQKKGVPPGTPFQM